MASEVSLQSKYERLCAEFVKLRKKHNEYKDNVTKEVAELKKCEKEKTDRLHELERQYEELKLRLADVLGQQVDKTPRASSLDTLEKPVEPTRSTSNIDEQSNLFVLGSRNQACQTESVSSTPWDPAASECAIQNLTSALHQWLDAISSHARKTELSESQSFLLKRVSQLECEISSLSADLQLERKQHVTEESEASVPPADGGQLPIPNATDRVPLSERDTLMLEILRSRVESNMEQAQYSTSIASFLHDELRSVVPHLSSLAWELHESRATVQRLTAELERLKVSTSKQNDAMAQHMVSLTEELQHWRGSGRNNHHHQVLNTSPETDAARQKKNSRLNVLKR